MKDKEILSQGYTRLHLAPEYALRDISPRFFITRHCQLRVFWYNLECTAAIVIKIDKIDNDDDVAGSCRISQFPEKSHGGHRSNGPYSIYRLCAKAVGVGLAGEDCDVTAEPLHKRVPRVPLAPNWNCSLHWINSLRDYRRNFTSSVHRYLRVPSFSPWLPCYRTLCRTLLEGNLNLCPSEIPVAAGQINEAQSRWWDFYGKMHTARINVEFPFCREERILF